MTEAAVFGPPPAPANVATALLVVGLLAAASVAAPVPATPGVAGGAPDGPSARFVALLPNPVADGDAGELVVVEFVGPTDVTGWVVDDGESAAALPNRTLSGRVALSVDPPAAVAPSPNATVLPLTGHLALSNAGERVVLRDAGGAPVDAVAYDDAPEGRTYVRGDAGWAWRRPGRTDLPVAVARGIPARVFVLPDSPSVPLDAIGGADERVLLGAYTFSSERTARALCAARSRGVHVAVLVEGAPVGGTTRRSARALDRLVACGVAVSALGGPGDRYGVHHPKYAVVDDRALVLSENWKPAGVGGRSSRGWGVLLDSPRAADALARTFAADAGYRDARPWSAVRDEIEVVEELPANGTYPASFPPQPVRVERVEVLLAPDNAEGRVVGLIDGAERSVLIQQVAIGSREHPFVEATLRAARRGVAVSVLLSSAWYVRADNRALAEWLNRLAREEGLPLEARVVRPRSRFEKTHVKGVVVDGEVAVVGSLNWNRHATRENREVAVVLHGREAAGYYARVFRADWRGGVWRLPVGFGLVALSAAVGAGLWLGRTVAFDARATEPAPRGTDRPPPVGRA